MSKNEKHLIKKRSFEAEIQRAEGDSADGNTIDLVFSTGHKGLRYDWDETYYEELEVTSEACDLSRLNSGAPFLADHWATTSQVIGVVERAWIEDGLGKATIKLSKRADVAGIVQDIKEGILKNISVGYRVLEFTDKTKKGDKYRTLLATKWLPMEISSVAIGFDPNAQTLRHDTNENEVIIRTEKGAAMEEETKTEQTKATETTKEEAVKPAETPKVDTEEVARKAVEEFQQRSEEIHNAVKAAGLDTELAADMVKRNLSMKDASTEIFKRLEAKTQEQKNNPEQEKEKTMNKRAMVIEALMYRADSNKFKCSQENELKGKSLIEIFESVVPRNAGESDQNFAKRAIVSADLADILVSASNKIVNETFGAAPVTYAKFTKPKSLRDFKATPLVQLSKYGLSSVTEGGDYTEATLLDSKEEITLRQRGILLTLSLKAIINDDLGMLQDLPQLAQSAGALDVEDAVYGVINANAAMSDTVALFHATHANLIVASGTNVDVASMGAAEQLLAEAVGLNGEKLELKPRFIIVSPKYAMKARQIVGSMLPAVSTNFNPYAGSGIEVIVTSRLTDKESWYVVADPAQMPAIITGTLEGMDVPQVSAEEQFSSSNMRFKVEYHNAAKALNYQAIIKLTVTP